MLFKMIDAIFRLAGYTRASEVSLLKFQRCSLETQVSLLNEEIKASEDENKSLWDMIDELQGSSKVGKDNAAQLLDSIKDALADEMLKDFKAVGEA
jgi:hypothetical protein